MFKKFLSYDEQVPYLVSINVDIEEKVRLQSDLTPQKLKPKCTITMTIYDREKNTIGKYKYVKKDFDKIRVYESENKTFGRLLQTEWKVTTTTGLEISDIMGIYVQTLQEMMANTDIIIP